MAIACVASYTMSIYSKVVRVLTCVKANKTSLLATSAAWNREEQTIPLDWHDISVPDLHGISQIRAPFAHVTVPNESPAIALTNREMISLKRQSPLSKRLRGHTT